VILLKPIVSEHSLSEAQKGRFSFIVAKGSRRSDVKRAVEKIFGVTVTSVLTGKVPARTYRAGKMRQERRSVASKKAIVTLASSQKIDLFEVGAENG
jgi:large subunit ribosomal protein L23